MRYRMMRFGQANLGIRAIDVFARHHQRADARDVGLERERLQVEHQLDVFLERLGHAHRLFGHREIAVGRLGFQDPLLDVADRVEILTQLHAVARAEPPAQAGNLLCEGVEDAAIFLGARKALFGGRADAEHPLEDEARVGLRRQRGRRGLPRHRIHVGAGVSVVARTDDVVAIDGDFERRQLRVAADPIGDHLIDRRPGLHVGAFGLLRVRAAHEGRRGAWMLAADVPLVRRLEVIQSAKDGKPISDTARAASGSATA